MIPRAFPYTKERESIPRSFEWFCTLCSWVISVKVTDIFENSTDSTDNIRNKTWIVMIENSNVLIRFETLAIVANEYGWQLA